MYCKHVCRQGSQGKVKCSAAQNSLQRPRWRLPAASSSPPLPFQLCLPGCRQVNFHISIWIESDVFCYANDSTVVSICVALAGLERRLLNKGVSGDGERKDHVSQSARWRKKTEKVDFSSLTSITAIPVFLCLISFCFS